MAKILENSNYLPKIYYEYERDADDKIMKNGDFFLVIELAVQAEVVEIIQEKRNGKYEKQF